MKKVTIVGGGVIGLTTAVILNEYPKIEEYNIEIVEKAEQVGSKSTSAAGCGLRTLYRHETNLQLATKGLRFWSNSEDLLGQEIGFRRNGYLFLTDNKETSEVLRRQSRKQHINGIPTIRDPSTDHDPSISEINNHNYRSSLLLPESALASPTKIAQALKSEAESKGVSINTGKKVTDIDVSGSGTEVITDKSSYNSDHVVNASGSWSSNIASMVNVDLPVRNTRRRLSILNKKVDPRMPLTVDIDTGVYLLPDENGQLMAGGNILRGNDKYDAQHPESFSESVSEDWNDKFRSLSPRIREELKNVEVEKSWTGLYNMTESRVPIIEERNNIIHVCGFSGHGIMQAPGAALLVSRKICGDQDTELSGLNVKNREFNPDIQF
jgi:sarcosine oxidase subunit beta